MKRYCHDGITDAQPFVRDLKNRFWWDVESRKVVSLLNNTCWKKIK
jgi:hypothetical protein